MDALPPPTAAGLLAKTPLAHLFTYVMERRLTGSLELRHAGGGGGSIVFFQGLPGRAATAANATPTGPGPLAALEARIQSLFELPPDTQFAFYEGLDSLAAQGEPVVQADPLRVLWAGIRRNPSWEHVSGALARVQAMALRLNASATPDRCGFTPAEQEVVELIRQRPMRVADLAAAHLVTPPIAQLFVYFLLITKQLELLEGPAPDTRAQPLTAQVARVQLQSRQVRPPAIVEEHRPSRPDARMSPPPQAYPIPEEHRAPSAPSPPSAPPPFNPFGTSAPMPATPRPAPSAPAAKAQVPAPAPSGPALSANDEALRAKIVAKAAALDNEDHYQVLGIERSMAKEDVQKVFIGLAKTWHPDKLPSSLSDLRDSCSKVFARITEAHAVLTDPARRKEYDNEGSTAAEQAEVQAILEAANNFQKALVFLKRNDTALGEELAKKALAADPSQADYLALVTWLDSQKPHNQNFERTRDLITKLDEAIRKNGNCERAHFYRGMLHKRAENPKQALKDFKRAVELNPHNLDAAREIRLHGMRQPTGGAGPKPDSIGGLFGRLFKK